MRFTGTSIRLHSSAARTPSTPRARPGSRKALCPNEWVRSSCRPSSNWRSTIFTLAGRCRSDRKPAPGSQSRPTSTAIPGSSPKYLQRPWRRIRCRAGLEDGRIHDLRYAYASRALALGESLTMIGKLLGYTQVQTTARYAHLANESVKASGLRVGNSVDIHIATNQTGQRTSCLSMKLSKAAETQRMSHRGFQSLCHIRVRTVQLPPTSL